jgi:glycosyltransferase involved in cell wall biosynthesis
VAQERSATTEEQASIVAQLQAALRDRDRQVFEQEQRISLLLRYIDEHERTLGAEVAASSERDWKIAALEQQLARGRWERARAGALGVLRRVALRAYRVVAPETLRQKLWERRHPYGPEARLAEKRAQNQNRPLGGSGRDQVEKPERLSVAIVTRNGLHGGVETMVALHQRCFNATVFVAGGQNRPDTCPFRYTYIDAGSEVAARQRLASSLLPFDVVIYHWIPGWAQAAIRDAGVPSIEVVHREDTSDNDKTIPTLIVTHSEYLATFLRTHYGVEARVISHGVDTGRFQPASPEAESGGRTASSYVGAITSYHSLKGVDLFLSAWAAIQHKYPQYQSRFYGSGPELSSLRAQAASTGLSGRVEILGPTSHPDVHITEFRLFVVPSRAEGMPFAVLEALAANVPVLASDLAPMQEFNEIAVTRGCSAPLVLFERDNLPDLIEKLDACLGSHSADREDTSSYIARYFSLEDHCQQYQSAMEQAVALHAGLALPVAPKRD